MMSAPIDHRLRRTKRLFLLLAAAAMVGTLPLWWSIALAIADGSMSVDRVAGDGWVASGVVMDLDLAAQPATARLRADSVQFAALGTQAARTLHDVSLDCSQLDLKQNAIACNGARIRGAFPGIGQQVLSGSVQFNPQTQALAFTLANIKAGGGTAQASGDWRNDGWSARLQLKQGKVVALHALLKDWTSAALPAATSGDLDIDVQMSGRTSKLLRAEWRLQARQLTASNAAGTLASEQLLFNSQGSINRISKARSADAWRFAASLASSSGQAYAEPIFLNFRDHPFTLAIEGDWRAAEMSIALRKFSLAHDAALSASGQAAFSLGDASKLTRLHLDIQRAEFPGAYALYLQPFLLSSAMGTLTTRGSISGAVDVAQGAPTMLALDMRNVSADDTQKRWSISELSGMLHWRQQRDDAPPKASRLGWQRAQVLGIDIGAAAVQFIAAGRDFATAGATKIPVLDGSIELAGLSVAAAGQADMTLQMDATLRPVSAQRLSAVFGWPQFGGRLSGQLANLQLRNGVVTLGTVLRADVFDGSVSVTDLRLEQPFSNWPRFSASIAIDHVDLEQVTSAFSFGTITGRLSGAIDDLRLFNWSPVSFDANLYTPPDDRSRHRISQRAVKNIGNLGGGGSSAAAALSGGLLRFFDNFNYQRVGIRCRLENDICTMNGVEPAPNGYYLVKGRGLPRIDVIGNATRVDWPRLVKQLQAATESQGPTTEPQVK